MRWDSANPRTNLYLNLTVGNETRIHSIGGSVKHGVRLLDVIGLAA